MTPSFFEAPAEFRAWLKENHDKASELLVGFRRAGSGLPSITWKESVDEALCYGWIDGLRKSLDETSYTIRFTPRKPSSAWSAINIKRVEVLIEEGRMTPAGLRAWESRHQSRNYGYSYDGPTRTLGPDQERELKRHPNAWEFFSSQAPSYQRAASHWVMSPKREETREKRLKILVEDSIAGRRIAHTTAYTKRKK